MPSTRIKSRYIRLSRAISQSRLGANGSQGKKIDDKVAVAESAEVMDRLLKHIYAFDADAVLSLKDEMDSLPKFVTILNFQIAASRVRHTELCKPIPAEPKTVPGEHRRSPHQHGRCVRLRPAAQSRRLRNAGQDRLHRVHLSALAIGRLCPKSMLGDSTPLQGDSDA